MRSLTARTLWSISRNSSMAILDSCSSRWRRTFRLGPGSGGDRNHFFRLLGRSRDVAIGVHDDLSVLDLHRVGHEWRHSRGVADVLASARELVVVACAVETIVLRLVGQIALHVGASLVQGQDPILE